MTPTYFKTGAQATLHPLIKAAARSPVDHTIESMYRIAADALGRRVLTAADRHCPATTGMRTAVIGPRFFRDFPLAELLGRGKVVALDVDKDAMLDARSELSAHLRDRLDLHVMDASLFATPFLDDAATTMAKHDRLTESWYRNQCAVIARAAAAVADRQLPFLDGSIDYWVCNNTYACMLISAFNLFTEHYTFGPFGAHAAEAFLLERDGNGIIRRDGIMNATKDLNRAFIGRQFEEVGRILSAGGIAFISDWLYDFSGYGLHAGLAGLDMSTARTHHTLMNQDGTELIGNNGDASRHVRIGSTETTLDITGPESLAEHAAHAKLKVIERFCYWDIPSYDIWSGRATVSLNEGVVVRRAIP